MNPKPNLMEMYLSRRGLVLGSLAGIALAGCSGEIPPTSQQTEVLPSTKTSAEPDHEDEGSTPEDSRSEVERGQHDVHELSTQAIELATALLEKSPYQRGVEHIGSDTILYLINRQTDTSDTPSRSPVPYVQVYYYSGERKLTVSMRRDIELAANEANDQIELEYILPTTNRFAAISGEEFTPHFLQRALADEASLNPAILTQATFSTQRQGLITAAGGIDNGEKGSTCQAKREGDEYYIYATDGGIDMLARDTTLLLAPTGDGGYDQALSDIKVIAREALARL